MATQGDATDAGAVRAGARGPIAWISWLRVLAIYAVVSIHNSAANASAPDARSTFDGWLGIVTDIPFLLAVPLFVMISGALALSPGKLTSTPEYLRKRGLRIVPPLVFWHLVYLGVLLVGGGGDAIGPDEVVRRVLTGSLAGHLYFFWIVLGLSLATPVLTRWIAGTPRREWFWMGVAAVAIPVLTVATTDLRGVQLLWLETPWTWWIPYLGLYILGYALRDVVLTGARLAGAALGALALVALVCWMWANPDVPAWLSALSPVSYYSLAIQVASVLAYLTFASLFRPGGALGFLTRGRIMDAVNALSAATLGIYGLHVAVLALLYRLPVLGPAQVSAPVLLARWLVASVVTTVVVLVARRVPWLDRVF